MHELSIIEIGVFKNWGGKEQHIVELAQGLKKEGHSVLLATRDGAAIPGGVEKVSLPLRGAADVKSIFSLARLIRRRRADIIHAHNGREAWIAILAALAAGQGRVVVTRHAVLPQKKGWLYAWAARRIAGVICVSEMTRRVFLNGNPYYQPERVKVVYNGIDLSRFQGGDGRRLREQYGITAKDAVIGFIGKYDSSKGTEVLIRAMAAAVARNSRIKAIMAGKTQVGMEWYQQEMRRLIVELGMEDHVFLHGFTADIASVIDAIDIFTLPSTAPESFGLVLLEAMAGGKPVITTSNGGQTEFVENNGNGLLVEAGSVEELTAAILALAADADKARRLGEKGKELVYKRFSLENMVKGTVNVFRSCLSRSG